MFNLFSLLVNMENLKKSLEVMWKGVLAIFVVIILIIISVLILNKISAAIDNKKKKDE